MNWDALGAVGEIIGAIAVLLTLGYLALQIRQNTQAVQASAVESSIKSVSEARSAIFVTAGIAEIYEKGISDPEQLTGVETIRFRLLVHNLLLAQANVFAQMKYSNLPSSTWKSQRPAILRVLKTPGGKWFWDNYHSDFESEFSEEIETLLGTSADDT